MGKTVEKGRKTARGKAHEDPFFYGFRYVDVAGANGEMDQEMVPLTEEDALHPQEGDHISINKEHWKQVKYLANVLEDRPTGDPTVLVTCDRLINWGIPGLRSHSPDIGAFRGFSSFPPDRDGIVYVRLAGAQPLFLIEVVSESTRDNDWKRKPKHYHQAGVPLYIVIDRKKGRLTLTEFRWSAKGFAKEQLAPDGRVRLDPFRLELGIKDDQLVLYDLGTGQAIGDYAAERAARQAADDQARAERVAREEADEKARAERAARQEADEKARAERAARQEADEKARVAEENARVAEESVRAERAAREEAERSIQALQHRLRQLEAGDS